MELLFESRVDLLRVAGQMHFFQRKPFVTPEPVLVGDTDIDACGAHIYGSVHHDGGVYRMWYQATPANMPHDTPVVAYAESADGVTWQKPTLNLVEWNGSKANNLVDLWLHCPTITIQPDGTYLATGCVDQRYGYSPTGVEPPMGGGYFISTSKDGLHWTVTSSHPQFTRQHAADNIYSIYHPARQCTQTMLKINRPYGGIMRRSWHECEMRDGAWSRPRLAVVPDDFDDVAAQARGFATGDLNGIGLMSAGRATVGFMQMHRNRYPHKMHPCGRGHGVYGVLDVALMYQPDEGACWLRTPGRPDFVTHGEVDWARGMIFTAGNVETFGDEQRLYITGNNDSHGVGGDDGNHSKIGYAAWPKWRLFGFHADPEGELDIELGELVEPCELKLNYVCEPGGSIAVRVHTLERFGQLQKDTAIAGRDRDDAIALDGDALEATASWKNGTVIQPVEGQRVVARLCMERSRVYAFAVRNIDASNTTA